MVWASFPQPLQEVPNRILRQASQPQLEQFIIQNTNLASRVFGKRDREGQGPRSWAWTAEWQSRGDQQHTSPATEDNHAGSYHQVTSPADAHQAHQAPHGFRTQAQHAQPVQQTDAGGHSPQPGVYQLERTPPKSDHASHQVFHYAAHHASHQASHETHQATHYSTVQTQAVVPQTLAIFPTRGDTLLSISTTGAPEESRLAVPHPVRAHPWEVSTTTTQAPPRQAPRPSDEQTPPPWSGPWRDEAWGQPQGFQAPVDHLTDDRYPLPVQNHLDKEVNVGGGRTVTMGPHLHQVLSRLEPQQVIQQISATTSIEHEYPGLEEIPATGFTCTGHGTVMLPDPEAGCQVFHLCGVDGSKESFLCPKGSRYDSHRAQCASWTNVPCPPSKHLNQTK